MKWVSVREIYAEGKHNAWPDICRWKDRYYVTFSARGTGHAEPDHGIVAMSSADGDNWETVLDVPGSDWKVYENETAPAYCPKLFPTDRCLHMLFWCIVRGGNGVSEERKDALKKQWLELGGSEASFKRWLGMHKVTSCTGVSSTEDGITWAKPRPLLEPSWWTWKPHTFQGRHYQIGMRMHGEQWEITPELRTMIPRADSVAPLDPRRGKGIEMFTSLSLFASEDGLTWERIADIDSDDNDESDFDFAENGRILMVCRNGAALKHALAYVSDPPYQEWRKMRLSETIHSPAVLRLGERWLVGGRYIDETSLKTHREYPEAHFEFRNGTRLWFIDEQTGELTDVCTLPSWGDCAYPGMVMTPEGDLLVVYYSASGMTEENSWVGAGPLPGKYSPASIYVARVKCQ